MPEEKKINITWYAISDYFMAALAWFCFLLLRNVLLNGQGNYSLTSQSLVYILITLR